MQQLRVWLFVAAAALGGGVCALAIDNELNGEPSVSAKTQAAAHILALAAFFAGSMRGESRLAHLSNEKTVHRFVDDE